VCKYELHIVNKAFSIQIISQLTSVYGRLHDYYIGYMILIIIHITIIISCLSVWKVPGPLSPIIMFFHRSHTVQEETFNHTNLPRLIKPKGKPCSEF